MNEKKMSKSRGGLVELSLGWRGMKQYRPDLAEVEIAAATGEVETDKVRERKRKEVVDDCSMARGTL